MIYEFENGTFSKTVQHLCIYVITANQFNEQFSYEERGNQLQSSAVYDEIGNQLWSGATYEETDNCCDNNLSFPFFPLVKCLIKRIEDFRLHQTRIEIGISEKTFEKATVIFSFHSEYSNYKDNYSEETWKYVRIMEIFQLQRFE